LACSLGLLSLWLGGVGCTEGEKANPVRRVEQGDPAKEAKANPLPPKSELSKPAPGKGAAAKEESKANLPPKGAK
jgi:hypothetical protein